MKREAGGPRIARLLLLLTLTAGAVRAEAFAADEALARARAEKTWNDPQWRRLGHWKRSRWLGETESDASGGFFLSPEGGHDPRAELEADVAALYAAPPSGAGSFRCRFPARTEWLTVRLGLDPASFAAADCSKYENWRKLLDADSASLIFASAYLDNPSSMFGHTFLRLERRDTGGDPLRDNTLNFAADTGSDGGVLFAVKGLLGLYPGKYTVMPYYMKIAEYNGIENRDLWEYSLSLSSAEVGRLAAHAWEMGQGQFPYYFFSKNCSYQLMPALEAAAPRLSLMPGSPAIVGPVDTLIAARSAAKFVTAVHYRPSHGTVMVQRRALLSRAEMHAAELYAEGRPDEGDAASSSLAPAGKALVLDSAEDYVLYKKGFSPDVPDDVRSLERSILIRRARIPDASIDPPAPSWAAPPEEGHRRHRLSVGYGARNGGTFAEVSWRPGYHDLLDRPRGYLPGAAIEGFSFRLRYDRDEKRAYVRDARLVEILSVAPWDSWTRKPSWSAGTGLDTAFELGKPASESLVYEGHVGTGLSAAPWDGALLFGLAQAEGSIGSPLRDGYRAGGAARAGLIVDFGAHWRVLLDGALGATAVGDRTPNHRLRAGLNWAPARDFSVRAEGLLRGPHREAGVYANAYY
ncbi:MAG: DUF4105 domain-containing protein [Elusimicrobia bacterium]|nr:DUF4105 domain-containing protein [Elusimicrobiota bacterium]